MGRHSLKTKKSSGSVVVPVPSHDEERPRDRALAFCVCGHYRSEHANVLADPGMRCLATEPDPVCSCAGYRRGMRS